MTKHECDSGCQHGASMDIKDDVDSARRGFLKDAVVAGGGALSAGTLGVTLVSKAQAQVGARAADKSNHYHVAASDQTVHWGYFSRSLKPLVEVNSGDFVTMEALTHHAYDDFERMIKGDPGAESVFRWDRQKKNVDRRGAGRWITRSARAVAWACTYAPDP